LYEINRKQTFSIGNIAGIPLEAVWDSWIWDWELFWGKLKFQHYPKGRNQHLLILDLIAPQFTPPSIKTYANFSCVGGTVYCLTLLQNHAGSRSTQRAIIFDARDLSVTVL